MVTEVTRAQYENCVLLPVYELAVVAAEQLAIYIEISIIYDVERRDNYSFFCLILS